MRYAIISDIHANLQAWNAALTDIASCGVDQILCLGDVVGYGPNPADVLEKAYAHVHHFVLGNHDAVVCGRLNPVCFNENARRLIEWTAEHLDGKAADFFKSQSYVLAGRNFRCAHADPSAPSQFGYIIDADAALRVWDCCPEQVVFLGHSHVPGLFVQGASGVAHWLDPQDFGTEEGKRYIVNVGSIGQPRDGDVRACYCLFDTEIGGVDFRRVPFDLDAYREHLAKAAPPATTTYFLQVAQERTPPPLRDMLDFHPPDEPDETVDESSVVQLEVAVKAARRWRLGAALLTLLLLISMGVGVFLWLSRAPEMERFAAIRSGEFAQVFPGVGQECLAPPEPIGMISEQNRLPNWTVELADPRYQQVYAENLSASEGEQESGLRVRADRPLRFRILSQPVSAQEGMFFQVEVQVRRSDSYSGHAELCLLQRTPDGIEKLLVHKPTDPLSADRWKRWSPSHELKAAGTVYWVLQGQLTGEIVIRRMKLWRKQ